MATRAGAVDPPQPRRRLATAGFGLLVGCAPGVIGGAEARLEPDPCPAIFGQDRVPELEVAIAPTEWAALEDEFLDVEARDDADLELHPYHPIGFREGGVDYPGVMLRLKGNSSWRQAIELDPDPKMQFVIAFNEVDADGRFFGLRKLELDMPRSDRSYLRHRLGLAFLRRLGLPAPCANNARLVINGAQYGLYTAVERLDKEFLQRVFGSDDEGDLWESAWRLKTNEDHSDPARIEAFRAAADVETLAALADLPAGLAMWAGEAMMPDYDGYYGGGHNFYLYDHPTRGFVWLPHDKDSAFDYAPADMAPVWWARDDPPPLPYWMVMNHPAWLERYVAELAVARAAYDAAALAELVDTWSAQIAEAAAADPRRPFSLAEHAAAVDHLRGFPAERAAYVDSWLACLAHGGRDDDGDGHAFCRDCDDADPAAYPGATERCNQLDDDCDGAPERADASPCLTAGGQ